MERSVPYFWIHLCVLIVVNIGCHLVVAEEECLTGKIECFICDSRTNQYCNDPFNFTGPLPPIEDCEGCCVKIVQNQGTPNQTITRTCTKKLKINLFMVDHVCMKESNGQGHMCFCEEDQCNGGPAQQLSGLAPMVLGAFAALLSRFVLN